MTKQVRWLGLGLALLTACGRISTEDSSDGTDDIRHVIESLKDSQVAGVERHDLPAYLSVFAGEATLTVGRGPWPGPFDRTLAMPAIVATRTERFYAPPPGEVRLRHRDVEIQAEAGRLIVRWLAERVAEDGIEVVREVFVLRPARPAEGSGWLIVHNRLWPEWQQDAGQPPRRYEAATWAALDAAAARPDCESGPCPLAMLEAWRFVEAHEAAIRWSEGLPAGARGDDAAARWVLRGLCAVFSGRVADAQPSFGRALAADPAANLPPWRSAAAARRAVAGEAASAPASSSPP